MNDELSSLSAYMTARLSLEKVLHLIISWG